jgi:hypothetical protein
MRRSIVSSDQRALLRTHNLDTRSASNHVASRPSIMNPRVGSDMTDFDRAAIRAAFSRSKFGFSVHRTGIAAQFCK